jgi:hypothetical protein
LDNLYVALGHSTADQLDLDKSLEDAGSATQRQRKFRTIHSSRSLEQSIVAPGLGLDEADRIFGCAFSSEVFGVLRSWHNQRVLDPTGPWSRLTVAIASSTEAHLFISDVNQSPFNVGTRLVVGDFLRRRSPT